MNLVNLRRFLCVVEEGSLNKAASRLSITQPALTKSIQLLEESLGGVLMHRGARGIELTDIGRVVYQRARLIDAEIKKLHAEVSARNALSLGEVNVGIAPGPGFQNVVLPKATQNLIDHGRNLIINYTMGVLGRLLPALRDGSLDFVIARIDDSPASEDLVQEPLFRERNVIVVRAGHPILQKSLSHPAPLADYPWVVLSEAGSTVERLRQLLYEHQVPMRKSVVRSDSPLFVKTMFTDSDCIGITRHDAVRFELNEGRLVELVLGSQKDVKALWQMHTIGLIYRRDAVMSAASRALVDEIRAESERAYDSLEQAEDHPLGQSARMRTK